ncbi:acyl-CoA N-acyltransferase [Apodospora peruviana]|uniref:Acyl-CoA N-acyltransferase n=1 Tax=Apodospora peruviana TaxID=516989 RepID=A0AAE0ISM8_9PEZI|nr:acyl-CoA N-acyltransferase [Apodospora peruviana]
MDATIKWPGNSSTPDIEAMDDPVLSLRAASRKLVREWGFLRPKFAGSALSPAAVHCLIEIADHGPVRTFSEFCTELQVSPKELRRIVAKLAVNKALQVAHPSSGTDITTAFQLYAASLEMVRLSEAKPTPEITPSARPARSPAPPLFPAVTIVPGYRPNILGRTLEMHLYFYSAAFGWGREFDSSLATGLGELLARLHNPVNKVWAAIRTTPARDPNMPAVEQIVGVIYVDGEHPVLENSARIRAFIVDDSVRGLGLGKQLFEAAMAFVRSVGFRECRLYTMRQLTPAVRLYEREGFVEVGK